MVKHDKSEQTDVTPEEFELDDCLLESNDIVITQNKDGFVLHVKKLGNITTAKLAGTDDEQSTNSTIVASGQAHITDVQELSDVKPTLTTLTTSQSIKLPSTECELINLKKIIPASTTISAHPTHATATIIQPHQLEQHHLQEAVHHAQVQSIVTTHPGQSPQTINLVGLRNVQITPHEPKPLLSRIKYSRGKIITPQNVQIVAQEPTTQHVELTEGTKYEINEIDLTNPNASEAMIRDLVKYAEIDDIQLEDGTKIGIGFAPSEITEHMQLATTTATITAVDDSQMVTQHHQQQLHLHQQEPQHHHHQHHQQQQHHLQHHLLQEHDDATTSVEEIIPDPITVHDPQTATITKSYTILTTRPMKQETDTGNDSTTTYELSLSESLLSSQGDDPDSKYICRHCGKRYRWKSTLRRHENVECGGKEPCHPCPYCSYKAKQRGNLGVHVRKHHPDKPQLESKRGRKM